jgi:hypothetical protein
MCGTNCVDTYTNPAHCGGCDQACTSGRCRGGVCATVLPGEICETAVSLATGDYVEFDLEGYGNEYRGVLCSSGSVTTGDYAFRWTAPTSDRYEVYVSSSRSERLSVGVFGADCTEAGLFTCDSAAGSIFMPFTALAGTEYRIVVGSHVGEPYPGTFTIRVRLAN